MSMNSSIRGYFAILLTLCITEAAVAQGKAKEATAGWPEGYVVHEKGDDWKSPDGVYAFLVPTPETLAADKEARAKLVDLKEGKIVHVIEEGAYFPGMNQRDITLRWWKHPSSENGWACSVLFEASHQPDALVLVECGEDLMPHETDLWSMLREHTSAALRVKFPGSAFEEGSYVLSPDTLEPKEGTLEIVAVADSDPKENDIEKKVQARVEATYTLDDGTLSLRIDGKEVEPEMPEKKLEVSKSGTGAEEEAVSALTSAGEPPEVMKAKIPLSKRLGAYGAKSGKAPTARSTVLVGPPPKKN